MIPRASLIAAAVLASAVNSARSETLTFLNDAVGSLPPTIETGLTGGGAAGQWDVVEDATAEGGRALAQLSADQTGYRFPLAVYTAFSAADAEVSAHFKPVSGRIDQAGGVVVRLIDENNYYVARANALEGNVGFYRVVEGRREQLDGARVVLNTGEWHTLTLRAEANRFTVSFDGTAVISAIDGTFAAAGKVGVWTKADSVTYFDRIDALSLR